MTESPSGRCVSAAKQIPHRPGLAPVLGLRTGSDGLSMISQTAMAEEPQIEVRHLVGGPIMSHTNVWSGVRGRWALSLTVHALEALRPLSYGWAVLGLMLGAMGQVRADYIYWSSYTYGNTAVNYQGTVTFSTSDTDPGIILPADYTFTAADAGVHTFTGGVTLNTPGDQTVTVTPAGLRALWP